MAVLTGSRICFEKPFGLSPLVTSEDVLPVSHTLRAIASSKCVPCDLAKPFTAQDANEWLKDFPGWSMESGSIVKEFRFRSYSSGLDFVLAIGKIAEQESHHPEMLIRWRRVRVTLSTHAIKGLSQNDFIMAAKTELAHEKISEYQM